MGGTVIQTLEVGVIPLVITFINDVVASDGVNIAADMLILTGGLEKLAPSLGQSEINTVAAGLTSKLTSILTSAQAAIAAANTPAQP